MERQLITGRLHIRFEGRSMDLRLADLDLGLASSDGEIRVAIAGYLEVIPQKLAFYIIERNPNGNITLRPEAVFG